MENQELLKQIQDQFENIQKVYGINLEDLDFNNLENILDESSEEMNQEMYKLSQTKTLKVKKIHADAVLPKYNYPSDSGFDLYSTSEIVIPPFGRALIPTGLVFQFPKNHEIQVRPKSGLAINQGLTVLNTPGTVDQGYTGEIQVIVFNTNQHETTIKKGMKVAQAVLCPVVNGEFVKVEEIQDIEEKDRGDKGFGSTGI